MDFTLYTPDVRVLMFLLRQVSILIQTRNLRSAKFVGLEIRRSNWGPSAPLISYRSHGTSSRHHSPLDLDYYLPRGDMTIIDRQIATISLKDYETRQQELVSQLVSVAESDGFFALTDHGITDQEIQTMFAISERFFSLPPSIKAKYPFERSKVFPHISVGNNH